VNTGILEREAGDPSAAVRDLRAGLAATPDDGLAWGELGLALEQMGSLGQALDAYLEGMAAAPGDTALAQTAAGFLQRRSIDLSLLRAYRQAATEEERRRFAAALRDALSAPARSRS
jgi:tetratricopeptide (TPR) repeat protein